MNDHRPLAVYTLRFADIRTGLLAGLAGGATEIGVVGLYSAIGGTDASAVAWAVAKTAGFTDPSGLWCKDSARRSRGKARHRV